MSIYYYSGNQKILIKLALRYNLYVCKDWNLYRWLMWYKSLPPCDSRYMGSSITLVIDGTTPVGIAFTHVMYVGKDDAPVLDLNLYLKSQYREKGIGSKMLDTHINYVSKHNPNIPIMFNYGLMSNFTQIAHFKNKYKDLVFLDHFKDFIKESKNADLSKT